MPVAPPKNTLDPEQFDVELDPHVLTDKNQTKLVPCTECRRCCVVTTFMAPAKVKCSECSGSNQGRAVGSQAVVQAGRTAPELAANLADCLINKEFAHATCPLCSSAAELKSICHSSNYGPRHLLGYKNGTPQYDQQTGESVMLQCNGCKTVISFSTMHPEEYRRQNEPKQSARTESSVYAWTNGVRDEAA